MAFVAQTQHVLEKHRPAFDKPRIRHQLVDDTIAAGVGRPRLEFPNLGIGGNARNKVDVNPPQKGQVVGGGHRRLLHALTHVLLVQHPIDIAGRQGPDQAQHERNHPTDATRSPHHEIPPGKLVIRRLAVLERKENELRSVPIEATA